MHDPPLIFFIVFPAVSGFKVQIQENYTASKRETKGDELTMRLFYIISSELLIQYCFVVGFG